MHHPIASRDRGALSFAKLLTLGFLLAVALVPRAFAFGFDDVTAQARELASKPYRPPPTAQQAVIDLEYDAYRDIRFRPSQSIWRADGRPFELQLFHTGYYHRNPVQLFEIADGVQRPLPIPQDAFTYGKAFAKTTPPKPEPAGFRVHYPINKPDYKDEVIAFLGASYFRAIGAGQHYGLSARGLAIDSTGPSEEFPVFEAFWLERPAADAKTLTVLALMNSPRVNGAYRFVITPGASTVVEVQARLFLRGPVVGTLGIAPLTSMFLGGENQPRFGDFRPEVHDSDGLQVASADGEWIWRPLVNPRTPFTTSFTLRGLRGFGLLQRDHNFASYEDTEARYENRPSVWIEPVGDWGPGRVELMQFNTVEEIHDNIVAYWVPARLPPPGEALDLQWRMQWQGDALQRPPGAWVAQSRRGHGWKQLQAGELQYVVDFVGGNLPKLDDESPVQAVVNATGAQVKETNVYRVGTTGAWRMTVKFKRDSAAKPVELRAFLKLGSDVLSETWSYALPPD
jgi:glucans biosynthesis protein